MPVHHSPTAGISVCIPCNGIFTTLELQVSLHEAMVMSKCCPCCTFAVGTVAVHRAFIATSYCDLDAAAIAARGLDNLWFGIGRHH